MVLQLRYYYMLLVQLIKLSKECDLVGTCKRVHLAILSSLNQVGICFSLLYDSFVGGCNSSVSLE